jgi:2'-5' RNA ligase
MHCALSSDGAPKIFPRYTQRLGAKNTRKVCLTFQTHAILVKIKNGRCNLSAVMLHRFRPCIVSFLSFSIPSPFRRIDLQSRLAGASNTSEEESSASMPMSYRYLQSTTHNLAVCVVPPNISAHAWETIGQIRTQLRDPNFFRWPPHINLLYPFVEPVDDDNVIERLALACRHCPPFEIAIQSFGTFGSKNRGVLWLDPVAPELATLQQSIVQEQFPELSAHDTTKSFRAHMTVSHTESLDAALQAKIKAEALLPREGLRFPVGCIYLIRRVGDDGQFMPIVEFPLGEGSSAAISFSDPQPFPRMPLVEAEWTRSERIKFKARRNGGNGRRRKSFFVTCLQ